MQISKVLSLDDVKSILERYENHSSKAYIKYFVNEQKENYPHEKGFFTDKFIVGIHNRHTHFSIAELQQYVLNANA